MQSTYPLQGAPAATTTCVVQTQPNAPGTRPGYNSSCSRCLGATQIAIGATCIILQIVAIGIGAALYFVGHGIWCGAFYVLSGSFGVVAAKNKRTGMVIAFMVLSILSAVIFVVPLIMCSSIGVANDSITYNYGRYWYYSTTMTPYEDAGRSAKRAINGMMIGLALLEGIVAVISSSICCGPLCCPGTQRGTVHTQGQLLYNAGTGQQVVIVTVPQGTVQPQYVGQPITYVQQSPPGVQPGQAYMAPPVPVAAAMGPPAQPSHEHAPPPYNPEIQHPPAYQEKI